MKILVSYRGIPQSPGWATGDMVVKAFRCLGHETFAYAKYYQENRWVDNPTATPPEFDLCLYMECNDGDPQYCELKNVRARKTACWTFDNSYYQDHLHGLVDYFNFNFKFFANPLIVKEFEWDGYEDVYCLPYACDADLHIRPAAVPKKRDIAIIGSIREDRISLVNELKKSNIEVELIGGLYREAYIDALAGTKIIINQNPPAGRGLLNMRFWETLAAGSHIITESEDADVNRSTCSQLLSENNKYDDMGDLVDKCRYLVNRVAKNTPEFFHKGYAQSQVLNHHTYFDRCQEMLKRVFPNEH